MPPRCIPPSGPNALMRARMENCHLDEALHNGKGRRKQQSARFKRVLQNAEDRVRAEGKAEGIVEGKVEGYNEAMALQQIWDAGVKHGQTSKTLTARASRVGRQLPIEAPLASHKSSQGFKASAKAPSAAPSAGEKSVRFLEQQPRSSMRSNSTRHRKRLGVLWDTARSRNIQLSLLDIHKAVPLLLSRRLIQGTNFQGTSWPGRSKSATLGLEAIHAIVAEGSRVE
ncbi:MAG: hypothetical protein Q9191_007136 [Dirinaria sp. TL-2023a]